MNGHTHVNANKCSPRTESSVAAIGNTFSPVKLKEFTAVMSSPTCCVVSRNQRILTFWRLLTTTRRYPQVSQDLECPKSIEARRRRYRDLVEQKFAAKPEPWMSQVPLVADTLGLLWQGPLPRRLFAVPFAASRLTLVILLSSHYRALLSTSRCYSATPPFSKPFPAFVCFYLIMPASFLKSILKLHLKSKIRTVLDCHIIMKNYVCWEAKTSAWRSSSQCLPAELQPAFEALSVFDSFWPLIHFLRRRWQEHAGSQT